ncbi:hypothetical protein [Prosthecobacter sp.]|uniref:hypothetical protein n=1 Tax=Prosthecobacter sp. TaxID=1965333 RepID=UPI002ABBFBA2|nr:hypothetical protein [Prosthecobacter sp.]MDZ4401930.1 hypothetical protein [Prosthecobacter sp.]
MEYAANMHAKSANDLLALWREAFKAADDPLKLDFIANALAMKLRDPTGNLTAVLQQVREVFMDASNIPFARWQAAQILGQAATRETVGTLLSLLASTNQPEPRGWLLDQIAQASQNNWSGHFHEEFTDLLTKAWQETSQPDVLPTLGFALASVGSDKAFDLLFAEIEQGGLTVSEFEKNAGERAWVAFSSLEHVSNPDASSYMEGELWAGAIDSITSSAAGYSLAKMGDPQATAVLLKYVQANANDLTPHVETWFSQMRDEQSVKLVDALLKTDSFANPQNRAALSNTLATWLAQRSENLRPLVDQ